MRLWFDKHKHLIGYLMIVAVAVFAIELHHHQTTTDINNQINISCDRAMIVAGNQHVVLDALVALANEPGSPIHHMLQELSYRHTQVPEILCDR